MEIVNRKIAIFADFQYCISADIVDGFEKVKKCADVQEYLSQKLTTSGEHVMYKNCSECQNKKTIYVHIMFSSFQGLK